MEKNIAIFASKVPGVKPWDPDSINEGITGAEEAVIYLSQALAKLGQQVTVFADPPPQSIHSLPSANPRFLSSGSAIFGPYDVAILWRMPMHAKMFKKVARKVYYWPHDICHRALPSDLTAGFDDVLWLSSWQREQWVSLCPGFAECTKIFGNGINPDQFEAVTQKKNPHSCIYGSNYARGLEILFDIWPQVKEAFPAATLDVYYSWNHWGLLAKETEEKMRRQLPALEKLGVVEHGLVSHREVNQAYAAASLWTYPCIMPETFCITALRAQLSGTIPVVLLHSALHETVRHGYKCLRREEYLPMLLQAMKDAPNIPLKERALMGEFVLKECTWEKVATNFLDLFSD